MKHELAMGNKAKEILEGIAAGVLVITHIYTDIAKIPNDNCTGWVVEVKTNKNHHLTLYLEGINISSVQEVIDFDGHRLIGKHNPLAVIDWLGGQTAADVEQAVLFALSQIMTT